MSLRRAPFRQDAVNRLKLNCHCKAQLGIVAQNNGPNDHIAVADFFLKQLTASFQNGPLVLMLFFLHI